MKNIDTQVIGKLLLRYGLVFVFFWFGINQLTNPEMWIRLIPEWVTTISGMSAHTFVFINGCVEIILALALTFNVYTSVVATLLAVHLFSIAVTLNFNAAGIRDVGLATSMLALAFISWNGKGSETK